MGYTAPPDVQRAVAQDVDLWERFTTKATALGATVQRAGGPAEAAGLLAREAGPALAVTAGLAEQLPHLVQALGAPGRHAGKDEHQRGDDGDTPAAQGGPIATEVAAAGRFAVAETGSVAVWESAADRGACFLADRLWLLVPGESIVPTLDDAMARLATQVRGGSRYLTLMSGPSRTADIERTLTIGVHGPRRLAIVIVDPPAGAGSGGNSAEREGA
ncbi:MAG TPA: lactate utilization protein [Chloroflexota bacterium]|nr:lactate utilization protein [Chloroflexota bacterium]